MTRKLDFGDLSMDSDYDAGRTAVDLACRGTPGSDWTPGGFYTKKTAGKGLNPLANDADVAGPAASGNDPDNSSPEGRRAEISGRRQSSSRALDTAP